MFTNLLVHLHAHPSGRGVFFLVTFSLLVSVPMAYSPGKPIGEWSRSWRWFGWWKGPRSFVGPSASSCHVARGFGGVLRGFGGDGEFAQRKDWTGVHVEDEQRGSFEGSKSKSLWTRTWMGKLLYVGSRGKNGGTVHSTLWNQPIFWFLWVPLVHVAGSKIAVVPCSFAKRGPRITMPDMPSTKRVVHKNDELDSSLTRAPQVKKAAMMDFVNFRVFGSLRVHDFSGENTHRIHGTGMHLPTFIVDFDIFDGKLVGKYIYHTPILWEYSNFRSVCFRCFTGFFSPALHGCKLQGKHQITFLSSWECKEPTTRPDCSEDHPT